MFTGKSYDVAVIGAGVFGAWTAWHLARRGLRVALLEAHGPAHSRASSGGESRIIRMSYGADELYTRWALRSLVQWKELFAAVRQDLFQETGVLWLSSEDTSRLEQSAATLRQCGIPFEELDIGELQRHYPQMNFAEVRSGIFEPQSGALLARRAVSCVVADAREKGGGYRLRTGGPLGRINLCLLAGRGFQKSFQNYWEKKYFRPGKKCFSSGRPRGTI